MPEHRAISLSDLADDMPKKVTLDGTEIVLVRQGVTVHAIAATCPHKGVPLEKGALVDGRIICPAHRAIFDLGTGEVEAPPACENIATYPARVAEDDVFVRIEDGQPAHPLPSLGQPDGDDRHFLIIGTGAAGWHAAETLRREGFGGKVTVLTDEGELPLDRTGFSKGYLAGDDQPEAPAVRAREDMAYFGIDLVQGRATEIDTGAKSVTAEDGETLRYDSLLIATGCGSRRLDMPGADLEGVHTLRTQADADALRADVAARLKEGGCHVAIIGSGFIGLEAATFLNKRDGVSVTVIAQEDLPLARVLGDAMGARLLTEHRDAGVTVKTSAKVTGLGGDGRVAEVQVDGGDPVACDLVLMAVGAVPRTDWLPFETGDDGGIAVDRTLAVPGHDDVFLAGDIARVPTAWGDVRIEHWRFAQELGALAARNMLGQGQGYEGTPFFWTMQHAGGSYTYTGHAQDWDRIDGAPREDKFAMSYVKEGRARAVTALGFDDRATTLITRMAEGGPLPAEEAPVYPERTGGAD